MNASFPDELRKAIRDCRERGLVVASRWAAESLTAIPLSSRLSRLQPLTFSEDDLPPFRTSTPTKAANASSASFAIPGSPNTTAGGGGRPSISGILHSPSEFLPRPISGEPFILPEQPKGKTPEEQDEEDTFELAKSFFDANELERTAWALRNSTSEKGTFLRLYAKYLSADKRMQDGLPAIMGTQDDRHALAPSFQPILAELNPSSDPFCLYLKGLVLSRLHRRAEAVEAFVLSVNQYACNWNTWLALSTCIKSNEQLEAVLPHLSDPTHPFAQCFEIHTRLDLHTATDTTGDMIDDLERRVFSIGLTDKGRAEKKAWVWGESQKGMVAYHLRDFETAEVAFDTVQQLDPYRLDDIDIYSNMLYVMPKLGKLAQVAKEYCEIDRNRPETCCLIGNFYSSRGEPLKAIQYFKRSLQLNRDYLPAWTLMGHEYIEVNNSHAAIEAYRRAVDVNPRDYRAWYGLGQSYELLGMPNYAIQYFNKATTLRPYDSRMWLALAEVYKKTCRISESIKCHERALLGAEAGDSLNSILSTLADLHQTTGSASSAAACHRRLLANHSSAGSGGPLGEMVRSYLFLAKYELEGGDARGAAGKEGGRGGMGEGEEPNWGLAQQYLQQVVIHNVPEREEAERLLKTIANHHS